MERNFTDEILPFLAGAGNSALFGLPEFIASKVNKEGVESYKKENAGAYGAGDIAGSIGSSFIPVVGIAGKAAQGIKGLSAAGKALQSLQEAKTLGGIALKGAAEGAIQAGARTATGNQEGDAMQNIAMGGGLGAAGGLAGGLLGKAKTGLGELAEFTRGQVLSSTGATTKDLFAGFQRSSGRGGWAYKNGKVDDYLTNVKEVAKKYKLDNPVGRDDRIEAAHKALSTEYKKLDKLYEKSARDIDGIVFGATDDALKDAAEHSPEAEKGIYALLKGYEARTGLVSKREFLQTNINRLQKSNEPMNGILADGAKDMREALDAQVNILAKASGDRTLIEAGKEWGALQTLGRGNLRTEMTLSKGGTGSPTMEKAMLVSMMGAGGAAGAGQADWNNPEEMASNLGKIVTGGALGAATSKAAPYLIRQLSKGGDTAINQIAGSVKGQNIAGNIQGVGHAITNQVIGNPLAGSAAALIPKITSPEKLAQSATITTESDDPKKMSTYHDNVLNKLQNIYQTQYAQTYGDDPQQFNQFVAGIYQSTNGFKPDKMAGVLFQDPDERKIYLKALGNQTIIKQFIEPASQKKLGFHIGGDSDEANSAYSAIESQFIDSLNGAGIDKKTAKKQLETIMSAKGSTEEKLKKIYSTMVLFDKGSQSVKKAGIA